MARMLRDINQRLEAIIKASPLAIVAMDENDDVTLWSPAAETIFGWAEQEVLGRALPTVPDADVEQYARVRRSIMSHGEPVYFEAKRLTKDGRTIDVALWGSPMSDAHGQTTGVMGLIADITQRKREADLLHTTNQALQGLIRAAPLSIAMTDLEGRVTVWNPASQRIFGWAEAEVLGRQLPIIPPDRSDQFRANVATLMAGQSISNVPVPCLRKDGSTVMVSLTITPVYDTAGKLRSLLGIMSEPAPSR